MDWLVGELVGMLVGGLVSELVDVVVCHHPVTGSEDPGGTGAVVGLQLVG